MRNVKTIVGSILCLLGTQPAWAQTTVNVVTYNVKRNLGGSEQQIVQYIRSQSPTPPVIALQEVAEWRLTEYKNQLAIAYPDTQWEAGFQGYFCYRDWACFTDGSPYVPGSPDNIDPNNGVAVLAVTTLAPAFTGKVILAQDQWWRGRGVVHARLTISPTLATNVISGHAPVNGSSAARTTFVTEVNAWASGFTGARLFGTDLNTFTWDPQYPQMTGAGWVDAWVATEAQHPGDPGITCPGCWDDPNGRRIDYWFDKDDGTATATPTAAAVGHPPAPYSDHYPLFATYQLAGSTSSPPPAWNHTDDFNDSEISPAKWIVGDLFSGSQTSAVAVSETTVLRISLVHNGPGVQYNGVQSNGSFSFENAEASVALVRVPNPVDAYAMFTIGTDSARFYRLYVSMGQLVAQKNIATGEGKITIATWSYNETEHRYLRIRNASGSVHFDTRSATGTWQNRWSEPWAAAIPLNLRFELKGGTSAGQPNPGIVEWDDFAAHPSSTPPPGPEVILEDSFDAGTLDLGTWSRTLITPAQSAAINADVDGTGFRVGPLPSNTNDVAYNGIASAASKDFTGASAWVRVDQVPDQSVSAAEVMFAAVADVNNFYRIYLKGSVLYAEKKVGSKTPLGNIPYQGPTAHAFWRIRHETASGQNRIVFETAAPDAGGQPFGWTVFAADSVAPIALNAMFFEMKTGISGPVTASPGYGRYAHFKATRP